MKRRYAFFPYLKSSGPVRYRNIRFGTTADLSGLPSDVAERVATLGQMFFLRDGLRIKNVTFAVVEAENGETLSGLIDAIAEFQAFRRYLYSAPHEIVGDPFLHAEHGRG